MSRFPHLAQTNRSTSIHQENEEAITPSFKTLTEPPTSHVHVSKHSKAYPEELQQHQQHQQHQEYHLPYSRRSISGNIVGPALSPVNNYDVPLVHSLRPQDMKSTVTDWIKQQNHKDQQVTLRLHSNVLRSASGSPLQLKSANLPSVVATSPLPEPSNSDSLPLSERGIIEDYEDYVDDYEEEEDNDLYVDSSADIVPSDDDSLDLEAPVSPHVLRIVGPSTDEATINGDGMIGLDIAPQECDLADIGDEYDEDESFDQRYSVLNPYEAYFEVEPLNLGSPLAPDGTPLDLSKVEPCINAFPFVHEPQLSPDELKLLALWDYELKQIGASGLDIQECLPGLDLDEIEDDDFQKKNKKNKNKKNWMSWLFNHSSPEERYAKKNPWYRILQLIDEYALFSSPASSRDDDDDDDKDKDKDTGSTNRSMIPIGYSGRLDLGTDDKQVVKLVPA